LTTAERADLERYLDVSRAELLFCSAAILVEGPSEVYLVPAIARALDFDLDAHGIVVADISGTNFGPYRTILRPNALNVPHVVLTDGDPARRGQYVLSGLSRAAKLLSLTKDRERLHEMVRDLVDEGLTADTGPARDMAMRRGVFVGVDTLEPDLAPLLGEEMIDAYAELDDSADMVKKFASAVRAIAAGTEDADDRKELLRRINSVSKGRFAQRLASHVQGLKAEVLLGDLFADDTDAEDIAQLSHRETAERLFTAGRYGYVLAALDRVSWGVRGHSLLDVLEKESDTEETESDDE
jgi:putative ATP-dependent endonuclease of the OLD family